MKFSKVTIDRADNGYIVEVKRPLNYSTIVYPPVQNNEVAVFEKVEDVMIFICNLLKEDNEWRTKNIRTKVSTEG